MTTTLELSGTQARAGTDGTPHVPLASVCDIVMGQAPAGDTYNTLGNGVALIAGAGDFSGGILTPKKFTDKPTKLSQPGDIVLSIRASIGDKVWADQVYCLGRGVAALRAKPSVDPKYLWHWVSASRQTLMGKAKGATFLQVNRRDIGELLIAVPPLAEQRRIAAILDKADELRTKRRQALAHLDVLTQSVFDGAQKLSEKNAVPLAELCDSIQTGPFGSLLHREDYIQNGVPLINPMHIVSGQVQASPDYSVATTKFEELRLYHLEADDIVLARRGEMGRCALVLAAQLPLLCGTGSMIVRPDSQAVSPRYLQQVLSSPSIRRRLEDASQGVTMSNLNGKILSGLRVRMPKLAIQREFSNRYVAIDRLRTRQRAQLDELDALFASLQNRAFKAEL